MKYGSKKINNTDDFMELFFAYQSEDNKIFYLPYEYYAIFSKLYNQAKAKEYGYLLDKITKEKDEDRLSVNAIFKSLKVFAYINGRVTTDIQERRISLTAVNPNCYYDIKTKYSLTENLAMEELSNDFTNIELNMKRQKQLTKIKKHNTIRP